MPAELAASRRNEAVRDALLSAALELFSLKGFDATSTREIADAAGAKPAMISYYFGGKEGLRAACVGAVAKRLKSLSQAVPAMPAATPEEARAALFALARAMTRDVLAESETTALDRLLMREISAPSAAFEMLFDQTLSRIHVRCCELLGLATGLDPAGSQLRILHATFIGQILYFRFSQATFLRRMGWSRIGPSQLAEIEAVILANLEAALNHYAALPACALQTSPLPRSA